MASSTSSIRSPFIQSVDQAPFGWITKNMETIGEIKPGEKLFFDGNGALGRESSSPYIRTFGQLAQWIQPHLYVWPEYQRSRNITELKNFTQYTLDYCKVKILKPGSCQLILIAMQRALSGLDKLHTQYKCEEKKDNYELVSEARRDIESARAYVENNTKAKYNQPLWKYLSQRAKMLMATKYDLKDAMLCRLEGLCNHIDYSDVDDFLKTSASDCHEYQSEFTLLREIFLTSQVLKKEKQHQVVFLAYFILRLFGPIGDEERGSQRTLLETLIGKIKNIQIPEIRPNIQYETEKDLLGAYGLPFKKRQ